MSWSAIAVNYETPRGKFGERGTTSAQVGYCEAALDELWDTVVPSIISQSVLAEALGALGSATRGV